MNKKYIKENKTLVREFLGALGQSCCVQRKELDKVSQKTYVNKVPENAK